MKYWKKYKYKNLTFLFLSLILAWYLFKNDSFHFFLLHIGNFSYIGAFFAGILFVSVFTVATATFILFILAETLHPVEIGLFAGLGAVIGDLTIFYFVKDNLLNEINLIYKNFQKNPIAHILSTKYFSWTMPVIGAIIIASPLPDEVGISLMGISKMKTYQFILISFILNSIGIFLIVSASALINK